MSTEPSWPLRYSVVRLAMSVVFQFDALSLIELGSVYSRLDAEGKSEWDALETVYHNGLITSQGYEHYLQMLLGKYGLASSEKMENVKTTNSIKTVTNDQEGMNGVNLCQEKVQQLEKEISELKSRLERFENKNI